MKFFGIDASGKRVALTHLSGAGPVRILADRILVGDEVMFRGSASWDRPNGQDRFIELVLEEGEAEPTPVAPAAPAAPRSELAPNAVPHNPKPVHTKDAQPVPGPAVPPARK